MGWPFSDTLTVPTGSEASTGAIHGYRDSIVRERLAASTLGSVT